MTEHTGHGGRENEVARRAYELWEEEGRPEGRDQAHWTQAEGEMEKTGEPARPTAGRESRQVLKPKEAENEPGAAPKRRVASKPRQPKVRAP